MAIATSSTANMGQVAAHRGVSGKYLVHPMVHDPKVRGLSNLPLKKRMAMAKHKAVLPKGRPLGPAPTLGHLGSFKSRVALNQRQKQDSEAAQKKKKVAQVVFMRLPANKDLPKAFAPTTRMSALSTAAAAIPWMRALDENLFFKPAALSPPVGVASFS